MNNPHQKQPKGILLVVEDNELAQSIYKTQITPLVKKVSIVRDAQTTLKVIHEYGNIFDLILLNIGLPDMNGFKLGEKLRKQGITIPIIAISANRFQVDIKVAYRTTFNEFIEKPLMQSQIEKLLNKYIH